MISIGITTFPRRFEMFKKLVNDIRIITDTEIIVQVNQFNNISDDLYRKEILRFCASVTNVYLTIYPSFTSLSKMWNTIVINSSNKDILVLNDDVSVSNPNFLQDVISIKNSYNGLCIINNSWAHYLISKSLLDELNYFDERLLAYGEEDGDMVWRYIDKFKSYPQISHIGGIHNCGEGYGIVPPNLKWFDAGNVIRPLFNRDFCFNKKYIPNNLGHKGMFETNRINVLANERQYPYESFKLNNMHNI